MPRTVVPKNLLPGPYPAAGVVANETAADVSLLNAFPLTGREIVIARNTDGAATHNVNVTSVADFAGRSQNITNDSLAIAGAAGSVKAYGPFATAGWQQADGQLYLSSDSALVKFTVLQIP